MAEQLPSPLSTIKADEWWCHWRDGDVVCTATGPYNGYCADHTSIRSLPCTCPDGEIAHRLDCPAGSR